MNDLCRNLGLETYTNGETVFNQGDIGDKVFILLSGACDLRVRYRIDLTQGESEIREKFIKTYTEQGSYFGERALQFDEPRSGTVVATDLLSLITVSKNSFVSVIKEAKTGNNNDVALTAEQLGTKETVINRFTMPQLVELCRVAETVSVWGRSILFKQGSIGQAFYVVLSGTVEVWVNSDSASKVLVSGEIFGERALENEDSMRMASIVTCEGNTELIIISREDYHNLV
ncbi:cyclic nucleotide-binding-like protein, partial [Ochromonadaceae sp. CCMP2298]